MKRTLVQVARIRIADLLRGDVVNADPDGDRGWFKVHLLRRLADGSINVMNESNDRSLTGLDNDIVGIQILREVEVDTPAARPVQPAPEHPEHETPTYPMTAS